jgi:hypothetical protein
MSAAQAWSLTPQEWRRQSVDDRARMLAHEVIKGIRTGYEMDHASAEPEKTNSFTEMKRRIGMGGQG